MKKILIVLVMLIMVSIGYAQDNRFVEEIKQWDFSAGGCAYLVGADTFYYSAGAKRDLGPFFNWLPNERLYGELGYLNASVIGQDALIGEKAYGYAGLSTNANFIVQTGIEGLNKLLNANFTTPEILNKVLATIGVVAAKKLDSDFWTIDKGYDWGINVAVIKFNW